MPLTCPKCGGPLAPNRESGHPEEQLVCGGCATTLLLPTLPRSGQADRGRSLVPFGFRQPIPTHPPSRMAASRPPAALRRASARQGAAPSPVLFALLALGTALLFLGSALLFRAPFVEARPGAESSTTAPAPRLDTRALALRNVTASRIVVGDSPILMIGGEIANTGSRELVVPAIRIALSDGTREIFTWTIEPDRATLAGGTALRFKSRVAAPAEAGNVELSFVAPTRE